MADQLPDGELVGVVLAPVTVATRYPRYPGYLILTSTTVLAVSALLAAVVTSAVPGRAALSGLPVPVLVLAAMTGVDRLLRAVCPLPVGGRTGLLGYPVTEQSVRRFRVQTPTGETFPCELLGEPASRELRPGDLVRLPARRARQGHVGVRRIDLLLTPTGPISGQVTARVPVTQLLRVWFSRLCLFLAPVVVAWVGYRAVKG